MKKNYLLLIITLLLFQTGLNAQCAKEINVFSKSMNKDIKTVVTVPQNYNQDNSVKYPVIYLLHGYGGNQQTWNALADLCKWATDLNVIFVCPDGSNSWYWDSPKNTGYKYETFVSKELTGFIDQNYRTVKSPESRAISGLSMGGHGALWLAMRHPDVFGAAGSTSGGVDIRPFPEAWDMKNQLGEYNTNKEVWDTHTVINLVDQLKNNELALIIDCGTNDFFFNVNNALHQKLLDKGIDHDYIVRPGAHEGKYWSNSIIYQIIFFNNFFNNKIPYRK